jgi:hypothetical protein
MSDSTLPPAGAVSADTVQRILVTSRQWNRKCLTTGALMFSNRRFAQVLEGPPSTLKATFGHISCDSRHKNVKLLECGPVAERMFCNWSMAYIAESEQLDLSLAAQVNTGSVSGISQGFSILVMLRSLVAPEPN